MWSTAADRQQDTPYSDHLGKALLTHFALLAIIANHSEPSIFLDTHFSTFLLRFLAFLVSAVRIESKTPFSILRTPHDVKNVDFDQFLLIFG